MNPFFDSDYSRSPGFLQPYREETQRMRPDAPPPPPPEAHDAATLLPILLLLLTEGADRWLLLALVYILL